MDDSSRLALAGRSVSLIPGVIYEWTPAGTLPVPEQEDPRSAEIAPVTRPFVPGDEVIDGYRLVEPIGEGTTGQVWRAVGPGGVAVALKFVKTGCRGAVQELHSLALMPAIRHANLVTIFGIWERDDWTAIGMDLAEGSLLDRFEAATQTGAVGFDFAELIDFLRQAARGIDFLNESRHLGLDARPVALIHRDIKPANLLLAGGSIKVGDFGLVQQFPASPDSRSNSAADIASLATVYTAPEVRHGQVSNWSDQYSLAAIYCHLRGGRAPSTPVEGSGPADLTMLPVRERPAVALALATEPNRRWPSCSAFIEALVASVQELAPSPALAPSLAARVHSDRATTAPTPVRSRRRVVPVLLAVGAVAALGAVWVGGSVLPPAASRPTQADPSDLNIATSVPVQATPAPIASAPAFASTQVAAETAPLVGTGAETEALLAVRDDERVVEPLRDEIVSDEEPALSEVEQQAVLVAWTREARSRLAGQLRTVWTKGRDWVQALPTPTPPAPVVPVLVVQPTEPPAPKTASIIVRLPNSHAELVVRGEVGRGNPDEWYGPRRVIHSPPLSVAHDYLIGAFWTNPAGQTATRSQALKVEPGRLYEVDLRHNIPTVVEVPRSPRF